MWRKFTTQSVTETDAHIFSLFPSFFSPPLQPSRISSEPASTPPRPPIPSLTHSRVKFQLVMPQSYISILLYFSHTVAEIKYSHTRKRGHAHNNKHCLLASPANDIYPWPYLKGKHSQQKTCEVVIECLKHCTHRHTQSNEKRESVFAIKSLTRVSHGVHSIYFVHVSDLKAKWVNTWKIWTLVVIVVIVRVVVVVGEGNVSIWHITFNRCWSLSYCVLFF